MPAGPSVLTRTTTDVNPDARTSARYIGELNDGTFRIDLSSALTRRDGEDFYRFRVATPEAFVKLFPLVYEAKSGPPNLDDEAPADAVRFQLLDTVGRVLADSSPKAGDAYRRYQDLIGDPNVKLRRGTYTLRVSRGPGSNPDKAYTVSLALRGNWQPLREGASDHSLRVYSTTEYPAPSTSRAAPAAPPTLFSSSLGVFVDRLA